MYDSSDYGRTTGAADRAYKKFAGEAVPVFRAKVVNYILENMTTLIMDDELIVGTATNAYRGANLHPEFQSSSWYISDIDDFSTRTKDPYYISPEDRKMILETLEILGWINQWKIFRIL